MGNHDNHATSGTSDDDAKELPVHDSKRGPRESVRSDFHPLTSHSETPYKSQSAMDGNIEYIFGLSISRRFAKHHLDSEFASPLAVSRF